jgi:hypothetical protein
MTSQTGNDVTSRFVDHGFLFVFNTYNVCKMHRLKVLPTFLIVDYGGMSISTARGHLRPEMRSPVDRATTVFYSCFVDIYRLSCTVSTLLALFLSAENGRKTISAARGRSRPEVTLSFDSLTPIWCRSVLEFCVYLSPIKSYSTFSICM